MPTTLLSELPEDPRVGLDRNSLADTISFLSGVVRDGQDQPRSRFALAVVHRQDNVLIGSIELHVTSNAHRRAEMGYVLGRP